MIKVIAAHKVLFGVGLLLAAAGAWYLHKRSSSGTSGPAAQGSLSPDYGGVAVSPYNDSAAPQFSFDLGSLLPPGPAGSSGFGIPNTGAPPPNKVPTGVLTPGGQEIGPTGGTPPPLGSEPIHWFGPGGSGVWQRSPAPIVSLPVINPFSTNTAGYVPASGVAAGHTGPVSTFQAV